MTSVVAKAGTYQRWRLLVLLSGAVVPVVAVLIGGGIRVTPAEAHAEYHHSIPPEESVLDEMPTTVDVYFTQEMRRAGGLPTLAVYNQSGDDVSLGATLDDANRTHMIVELPPALPEGEYTFVWHSLSDWDGDDGIGAFRICVTLCPTPIVLGTPPPSDATAPATPTQPPTVTAEPSTSTAAPGTAGDKDSGSDGIPPWAAGLGVVGGVVAGAVSAVVVGGRREGRAGSDR